MTLNGEKYLFDTEQAKSSIYKELYRLPLIRANAPGDNCSATIHTENSISSLHFIQDGEGSLDVTQNRPSMGCINNFCWNCWNINWDSRGISGDLIVYGS